MVAPGLDVPADHPAAVNATQAGQSIGRETTGLVPVATLKTTGKAGIEAVQHQIVSIPAMGAWRFALPFGPGFRRTGLIAGLVAAAAIARASIGFACLPVTKTPRPQDRGRGVR